VKTVIHVNQHKIKANNKNNTRDPVITVKTYKSNTYCDDVVILGQDGLPAAKLIYRPDKPLPCGAHVWVETTTEVHCADTKNNTS